MWCLSTFFLIGILGLRKILDILFECLVVAAGLFDELPILGSSFLQVFDLLVQLQQRAQLWDLWDFIPDLLSLSLFF